MTKDDTKSSEMGNMIGSAEHGRADGKAGTDIRPRIAVRVESYLAVPHFVAGPDRIALMQERLATKLAAAHNLRVLECPGDAEPIVEALWWHRQHEDDPAHAWLRRLVMETARRL